MDSERFRPGVVLLLVDVDHTGADIAMHVGGTLRSETVDGEGYSGRPRLPTDEAARKNVRAVADRVTQLVDSAAADAVFLAGEVWSRSDLLSALPERLSAVAVPLQVGARHSGHDFDEVQDAVEEDIAAVAPNPNVLSEQGAAPARTLRPTRRCDTRRRCADSRSRAVVVLVVAEEFFGVVEGVDARLAAVEV